MYAVKIVYNMTDKNIFVMSVEWMDLKCQLKKIKIKKS